MTHALSRALDTVLDRAVVPGYTRIGYRLRRAAWEDGDPAPDALRDKVGVVTGAGSGLGKAAATSLARLGASVHVVVRDLAKGRDAVSEIRGEVPGAEVELHGCDVSDLSSVRAFAAALRKSVERVDVLVHNAGTMPPERTETSDGHEVAYATHVLGPVLLTELLRPVLAAAGTSRVVVVSSGGMYAQRIPVQDPEFTEGEYAGTVTISGQLASGFLLARCREDQRRPNWRRRGAIVRSARAVQRASRGAEGSSVRRGLRGEGASACAICVSSGV